jgi:hypothetical protein
VCRKQSTGQDNEMDDNLPGKKGQKSRQGRRPSTRAEGAGRAAIESPFHRCRHRRSPAISLSPSTTRAASLTSFPIFFFLVHFDFLFRVFYFFGRLVDSVNRPKLRVPPFISHALGHSQAHTALTRQTPSDQLYNWGLPMKGKTTTTTHENPVSARGRKKKEHQHGRESERESHPFTTVGSTEMDPISR